jgi:hypothetical protein
MTKKKYRRYGPESKRHALKRARGVAKLSHNIPPQRGPF